MREEDEEDQPRPILKVKYDETQKYCAKCEDKLDKQFDPDQVCMYVCMYADVKKRRKNHLIFSVKIPNKPKFNLSLLGPLRIYKRNSSPAG